MQQLTINNIEDLRNSPKYSIQLANGEVVYALNLSGAIIENLNINNNNNIDFRYAKLENALIMESTFTNVNFSEAFFNDAEITDSVFSNVNFTKANFTGATLTKTKFNSCIFREAIFNKLKDSVDAVFNRCYDMIESKFFGANLVDASFISSNLTGAYFFGANLEKATLSNSTFMGAEFFGANLFETTVTDANFDGALNLNLKDTIGEPFGVNNVPWVSDADCENKKGVHDPVKQDKKRIRVGYGFKLDGHCYDVRSLVNWYNAKKSRNLNLTSPLTNKEFDDNTEQVKRIKSFMRSTQNYQSVIGGKKNKTKKRQRTHKSKKNKKRKSTRLH